MKINYRPDIDGLRGVAVAAVVLLHAGVPGALGGFVGVDVFFVISGFLITSIILPEIADQRFGLIAFYDRRIRRLFPALFVVLVCTTVLSVLVLAPRELISYGRSLGSAAGFVANFFFWRNSGYFAPSASTRPLLHTWTLSLEEQFYILFPLFLIISVRWLGRRGTKMGLALMLLLSLGLSEYGVRAGYEATFFLLPTRVWELLLGALTAIIAIPAPRRYLSQALASCGLGIVLVPVFFYGSQTPFPGISAALPCFGAALVLFCGRENQRTWVADLLSLPPLVYLGRISYSLYLWHWPLLVLARLCLVRTMTGYETALVVFISLILSALSWRYVEMPLRRDSAFGGSLPLRVSTGLGSMVVIVLVASILVGTAGLPSRVSGAALEAEKAADDVNPLRKTCGATRDRSPAEMPCLVGPSAKDGRYEVIVWGDSHADSYFPGIVEALDERRWTVREITAPACPPLLAAWVGISHNRRFPERCVAFNAEVMRIIQKHPALKLVVLASRWSLSTELGGVRGKDSREMLSAALPRTVKAITDRGIAVLLLGQAPEFISNPGSCLARSDMHHFDPRACTLTDAAASVKRNKFADDLILELASSNPKVHAFFPAKTLCDVRLCGAVRDGVILYRDQHHLTASGARLLGPDIRKALETLPIRQHGSIRESPLQIQPRQR